MRKEYTIGLDIGTNSVGWSVMDERYELIKKRIKVQGNTDKKYIKKNFWGVRLFEEGSTAEDTRIKRTTRRRYTRRANRLSYLKEIFYPEINKIDPHFFDRLTESFYVVEDKKYESYPIFGSKELELAYHKDYQTIYHLRKELIDNPKQQDIRLIYLACAHLIKYRGHFLIEGELSANTVSISDGFNLFLSEYNQVISENEFYSEVIGECGIESIVNKKMSRSKKSEELLACFKGEKSTGLFAQFLKLIVGNEGNFKRAFQAEGDLKLKFSSETYEEDLNEILSVVGDGWLDVFTLAKQVYDSIELAAILSTTDTNTQAKLSASMVERFTTHHSDLKRLKGFIKKHASEQYEEIFYDQTKNGYAGYIDGKTKEADFYAYMKKLMLKLDNEDCSYFLSKIEQEDFLRKQRTYDNGSIPNQIQLEELTKIIENQQKYYPFLEEATDKVKKIMTFRIPYYVGPLTEKESRFSWMVRSEEGAIRPWNFDEKVDLGQSAVNFIERMTNEDSYLPNEKVLPQNSLIYQKYIIFNELTKVKYKDDRGIALSFSGEEKQAIVEDLFKTHRKVSQKKLVTYLENKYQLREVQIVSGIENTFNASFSTYHDLLKQGLSKEFLDDVSNSSYLEDIIKKLTIFEDRKMLREQLSCYESMLSKKTLKNLERRHYSGWGRLSKKLLTGIKDRETGKSILDFLMEDDGYPYHFNRNFMQLINDDNLSFKKIISDEISRMEYANLEELVGDLPGSPAIKKGILQSLKLVEELVRVMGYPPKHIVVEMARENRVSSRSTQRLKQVENCMKELGSDLIKKNPVTNVALQSNRLFLYYLQNGKDMYTGRPLDIDKLSSYDIDHIIPQSFIKDNSLDNLVLVEAKANRGKSDDVPSIEIVNKNRVYWTSLYKTKAISKTKFENLTKAERGGLTDNDKAGFIRRQLVETRQITKHVARILDEQFNTTLDKNGKIERDVKIITLKSSLTNQFRKAFNIYKLRELNDYHHAHDAYLNSVVGTTILKVYPKLSSEFVYGEYSKSGLKERFKATEKLNFYTNIMKFFTNEDATINSDGEILWSSESIKQVKKVLGYNQMNIVKKVEEQKGKFSKETIYPRENSNKLIPVKNGLDTSLYGGFKSPIIAKSIVITYLKGKKKKEETGMVGIPLMSLSEYELDAKKYFEDMGYDDPKILVELPKYSVFEMENGKRRLIASATELQKGNQLVLSDKLIELLYHSTKAISGNKDSLIFIEKNKTLFDDFMLSVNKFSEKNIMATKNLENINKAYELNKDKGIIELAEASVNLLKFTKIGAAMEFNYFDVKIPRYRYTATKDIKELFNSILIYQSITGLYETRVSLDKL